MPEVRKRMEDNDQTDELSKRIHELFEKDEIFIDPNLTLSVVAKRLNAQPYLVSKAINFHFRKSFPEFLIQHRIRKAEQLLLSSLGKTFTIEAIAYESGFSTLSAFYTSFKKINKTTPAQFRKAKGDAAMKMAS
jgi:AraC-like DNA-binding protein